MKLEDIVCSLDLCKKLKELGIEKESQFYYFEVNQIGKTKLKENVWVVVHAWQMSWLPIDLNSAYTARELLECLPFYINDWDLIIKKCHKEYEVKYCNEDDTKRFAIEFDNNLSNCLAKMLIWLIENKHVKVEDLK
jgi:hypothetical protein